MTDTDYKAIKARVVDAAGGVRMLAARLGVTRHAIYQWDRVPAERLGQVAKATGLPVEEIRPDLFGD